MKSSHYVRGLGTGIIIAAAVLSIAFSFRDQTMSNKEIMEKAEALGMVREENVLFLKAEGKAEDEEKGTLGTAGNQAAEMVQEEEASDQAATLPPAEESAEEGDLSSAEISGGRTEPYGASDVAITITPGMCSEDIADLLEAAGLVGKSENFISYLEKCGYQNSIQTGDYVFGSDSTYEEIAETISGH